jgi:hypothetical protein
MVPKLAYVRTYDMTFDLISPLIVLICIWVKGLRMAEDGWFRSTVNLSL